MNVVRHVGTARGAEHTPRTSLSAPASGAGDPDFPSLMDAAFAAPAATNTVLAGIVRKDGDPGQDKGDGKKGDAPSSLAVLTGALSSGNAKMASGTNTAPTIPPTPAPALSQTDPATALAPPQSVTTAGAPKDKKTGAIGDKSGDVKIDGPAPTILAPIPTPIAATPATIAASLAAPLVTPPPSPLAKAIGDAKPAPTPPIGAANTAPATMSSGSAKPAVAPPFVGSVRVTNIAAARPTVAATPPAPASSTNDPPVAAAAPTAVAAARDLSVPANLTTPAAPGGGWNLPVASASTADPNSDAPPDSSSTGANTRDGRDVTPTPDAVRAAIAAPAPATFAVRNDSAAPSIAPAKIAVPSNIDQSSVTAAYGAVGAAATDPAPSASTVAGAASQPLSLGTPASFGDGLSHQLLSMLGTGRQEATLHLQPPELGALEIRVSVAGRDVSTWFGSAQPQVQQALNGALGQLRSDLAGAGLNLTNAWVGADASAERRQLDGSATPARRNFTGAPPAASASGTVTEARPRASGVSVYV